jgi:HemK-like putative methylase
MEAGSEPALSEQDALDLTRRLYQEHHRSAVVDADEPPVVVDTEGAQADAHGWYCARIELGWIAEWARQLHPRDPAALREALYKAVDERVTQHKPLSLITGSQPFLGCEVRCRSPILIPRTETEEWTFWLLTHHLTREVAPAVRVLDLCCGTGCIGLALAKQRPRVSVCAVDADPAAVALAQENYKLAGIPPERYTVVQSDMFTQLPREWLGTFDLIVTNPPYILAEQYATLPRTILEWEGRLCLVGDARHESNPLSYYKELMAEAAAWLKPRAPRDPAVTLTELRGKRHPYAGPQLVMEAGLQAEFVGGMFRADPQWGSVEVHRDRYGQHRWITADLTAVPPVAKPKVLSSS